MQPSVDPLEENNKRQLGARVGSITIAFPTQTAIIGAGVSSTSNVGSVTITT